MKESILKGRIHSFETFGATDGPGIRFVVFMQGCPFKCKYCHNRDTWDTTKGTEYSVDEVISKALRCKPYMDASENGGITVSGGEPLLQAEFVTEIFEEAHKLGISTCLDTSGLIAIDDNIKKLISVTDLVLLDIKHIDDEKCKELTGSSNENELKFARYLSENNVDMWIRQVLVPGYTDDEEDLKQTKTFIDSLNNVKKVEVLPYHNFGKIKWENLKVDYPLKNVKIPSDEQINKAKNLLNIL